MRRRLKVRGRGVEASHGGGVLEENHFDADGVLIRRKVAHPNNVLNRTRSPRALCEHHLVVVDKLLFLEAEGVPGLAHLHRL